MNKITKVTII